MKQSFDSFTFNNCQTVLDSFITYTNSLDVVNKQLTNKKIRMPNFPSEISENIAKFAIYKKYKICPTWDTKNGDISISNKYINKKFEIKAFSSKGPTSFGPLENWNYLYFVDATQYKNKIFKVYEIKLSNTNDIFKNIKVSNTQTFQQQCIEKRRPHICFELLHKQIKEQICENKSLKNFVNSEHVKLIFEGSFDLLK